MSGSHHWRRSIESKIQIRGTMGMKNDLRRQGFFNLCLASVLIITLFSSGSNAWAQATSGDIVGTVTDKLGAAIPNASVSVKNTETGVVTQGATNSVGDFHISNLLAGKYDITASAKGFGLFTLKGFEVQLNNTATAKIALPVAAST